MEQFYAIVMLLYVTATIVLSHSLLVKFRRVGGIKPITDDETRDAIGNSKSSDKSNINDSNNNKNRELYWRKITIKQYLTSEEQASLRDQFPGITIRFTNESREGHAFSHAFRMLERRKMLVDLKIDGSSKMLDIVRANGYDYEYIDVGGRITHQIYDSVDSAHTETPMLSSRDIARIENDRSALLNMYNRCKMGFFQKNLKKIEESLKSYTMFNSNKDTSRNIWCSKRSQDCKATAPNLIFLHSIYDMTSIDILNIFKVKKALRGMATVYFDFDMLNPSIMKGEIKKHNCIWEKRDKDIVFYFKDDYSHCYIHNLDNYLDKFTQTRLVSKDGKQVIDVEIVNNDCGIVWLKYTALPSVAANFDSNTRVLQNHSNNDKVQISYFKPVYNHLGQYCRKLKTCSMVISKEYLNKVLSEILRTDQGRFTITSVINIVTTFNNNIMINGSDIIKKTELDAMQNFELAHALFVYAFVYKMEQHQVSALLTARIKEVRAANESRWSFLYKILDYLPYFSNRVTLMDMDLASFERYILDVKTVFLECDIDIRKLVSSIYVKSDGRKFKARKQVTSTIKDSYDFSNSSTYAKLYTNHQSNSKVTCNKVMCDNISVAGDGDCGLHSYAYLTGDKTEPDMLRKQIMDYAAKNRQVADISGKRFLSFFDLKILAKIKGYNLCMHDGTDGIKYFVDHDELETLHIHFKDNHYTPVDKEGSEEVVKNYITKDGVICAATEGIRYHMDVNFMQDDGNTGGFVVLAFYVWLLSYLTKLPVRYSAICVFVYHVVSLYFQYVFPYSVAVLENFYWMFVYTTLLVYIYKCYYYDHLDRFNLWLRIIVFVLLYSVSELLVLSLLLMLTFDYLMIHNNFQNYYYFVGFGLVFVCKFYTTLAYLFFGRPGVDNSDVSEQVPNDITIHEFVMQFYNSWCFYRVDGILYTTYIPVWSTEGVQKLLVEPLLQTKVSVVREAVSVVPSYICGIFLGSFNILLVPFVYVYTILITFCLFVYRVCIYLLVLIVMFFAWYSFDEEKTQPQTTIKSEVKRRKPKPDEARLAMNKLIHARNKEVKRVERLNKFVYEIDLSSDLLFDEGKKIVSTPCHDCTIDGCYRATDIDIMRVLPQKVQKRVPKHEVIEIHADLMEAESSIAHCISADFHMGRGIAATVRKVFGCLRKLAGQYDVGGVYEQEADGGFKVYHLITKKHYYDKPTEEDYELAIETLRDVLVRDKVSRISVPELGCGLDGLSKTYFRDVIKKYFSDTDIIVTIYIFPLTFEETAETIDVERELNATPDYTDVVVTTKNLDKDQLPSEGSVLVVSDKVVIYTKRLDKQVLTREELDELIKHAPRNVSVQRCGVQPRRLVVLCNYCLDLQECTYYKILGYQQKLPLDLNRRLGTSIVYPPISTVAERFRNAVIERKHIADMTVKQIEHVHSVLANHLHTMSGASFDSKISNLQKLKEFKTMTISVYDINTQCFRTKLEVENEYMVRMDTGEIEKVVWCRDRDLNQNVLRAKVKGVYFTTNLLEIHNEPAISKKLDAVISLECDVKFDINMINGIPGCGKTTRAIRDFKRDYNTMIACATKSAAADVRSRLTKQWIDSGNEIDEDFDYYLNTYVRTIDSVLVNVDIGKLSVDRLMVDEALMRHPGEIYALVRILNVKHLELIGDKAQIPFVNRVSNYMTVWQEYPVQATEHMAVSYRCPVDAVGAISRFYPVPVVSASTVENSMKCVMYVNFASVPVPNKGTQVLVFKQAEKLELSMRWKRKVNTIHEFQGQQADSIVIVRLSDKPQEEIYLRDNYALVAITRHTKNCVYYTPVQDSICKLMLNTPKDLSVYKKQKGGFSIVSNMPVSSSSVCVFRDLTYKELELVSYNRPDLYILLTDEQRIALAVELGRGYDTVDIKITDTDKPTKSLLSGMVPPTNPLNVDMDVTGVDYTCALQAEFDRVLPANAHRDQMLDQLLVERSDLNLSLDNIKCKTMRVFDIRSNKRYDCLRPALNTSCPIRRQETDVEIMLGIQKRNANVPDIQGIVINEELAISMCKNFVNVFMDPCKTYLLGEYQNHKIGNSERATRMWAEAAGYSATYMRNPYLIDVMSLDFNRFNYSIKPTPKPVQTFAASVQYQALQTISAHRRYINAVFCPTIKEAKVRIKALLKEKYILFTDVSNEEFVKELNAVANPAHLLQLIKKKELYAKELDISKYDKSQGYEATFLVCWLLKLVGCDPEIIDYYQICQQLVRCNSSKTNINFYMNYQMKSGVALTLFGNTLFTMATNALVYPDNKVIVATFCGDDAFYLLKKFEDPLLDKSSILSNIINLEVKEFSYLFGYFCSKFLLMGATTWYFIPDPVKLLNKLGRFDIVSYQHCEEYRVSTADNYKVPTEEALFLLDHAVSERYKVSSSNVNLIIILLKVINNPSSFSKLYFQAYGDRPADRTVFRRDLSRD